MVAYGAQTAGNPLNFILKIIPLPLLMALGGIVFLAAAGAHAHYEWQKSMALEKGLPDAIKVSEIAEVQAFPWYEEVVVEAQMDEDLTYVYWEQSSEGTIEYPVIFLFDPDQTGPVREVYAAIAFDTFEEDRMTSYLESVEQGDGEFGKIFRLAGTPAFMRDVTSEEIGWAAEDLGITLADNFLYLNPYFEGRGARLEPQPMLTMIAGGLGIGLIWLGMIFQIIKRRFRRAEAERSAAGMMAKKGLVAAGGAAVGAMFGGDDEEGFI